MVLTSMRWYASITLLIPGKRLSPRSSHCGVSPSPFSAMLGMVPRTDHDTHMRRWPIQRGRARPLHPSASSDGEENERETPRLPAPTAACCGRQRSPRHGTASPRRRLFKLCIRARKRECERGQTCPLHPSVIPAEHALCGAPLVARGKPWLTRTSTS